MPTRRPSHPRNEDEEVSSTSNSDKSQRRSKYVEESHKASAQDAPHPTAVAQQQQTNKKSGPVESVNICAHIDSEGKKQTAEILSVLQAKTRHLLPYSDEHSHLIPVFAHVLGAINRHCYCERTAQVSASDCASGCGSCCGASHKDPLSHEVLCDVLLTLHSCRRFRFVLQTYCVEAANTRYLPVEHSPFFGPEMLRIFRHSAQTTSPSHNLPTHQSTEEVRDPPSSSLFSAVAVEEEGPLHSVAQRSNCIRQKCASLPDSYGAFDGTSEQHSPAPNQLPTYVACMRKRGIAMDISTGKVFPVTFSDPPSPALPLRCMARSPSHFLQKKVYDQDRNCYFVQYEATRLGHWFAKEIAVAQQELSDVELLCLHSTSPLSEHPDFVKRIRRMLAFFSHFGSFKEYLQTFHNAPIPACGRLCWRTNYCSSD